MYDDGLAHGWDNWGWGNATGANFKDTSNAHCGTSSVSFYLDQGTALSIHNDDVAVNISVYTYIEFFMKTTSGTVDVLVSFNDDDWYTVQSSDIVNYVVENSWTRIRVATSQIPVTGPVTGVSFASASYGANAFVYFDVTSSVTDTMVNPVSGTAAPYQSSSMFFV
jgi:hypothetical protein